MPEPDLTRQVSELNRRAFLGQQAHGIGAIALSALLSSDRTTRADDGQSAQASAKSAPGNPIGLPNLPHFAPKAKRVLCLFQSEGLSQVDLFEDKPEIIKLAGKEIPPAVKGTQRLTGMTSGQSSYPLVPPLKPGRRCGQSGHWISDLLPGLQTIADDLTFIRSMNTEAINHDPAITFINTGNQQPGYPAWEPGSVTGSAV